MDGVIGGLLSKLEQNKLLDNMNILIVSDHGMAKSSGVATLVTDYVDPLLIDLNRTVLSQVSNVYPKDMNQLTQLYNELKNIPNATVYYKNDVPASFFYSKSDRVGN